MSAAGYFFVLACLLWTLLAACVAGGIWIVIRDLIGIPRVARWLGLDIGEDE